MAIKNKFKYEGWSTRAEVVYRRTYSRPLDDGSFEDWPDTVGRVINHQRWLWERALGRILKEKELAELEDLRSVILGRVAGPAGRTLWLGGTALSKKRESSNFNCAFTQAKTVNDMVDIFWLLLQGCGVGFKPVRGSLYGFIRPVALEILPSSRSSKGGDDRNWEYFDKDTATWTVRVGDSAEAWAKSLGKILAHPYPASRLVIDFSQVRPEGGRLSGYGWACNGWTPYGNALEKICKILNNKAGQTLDILDILDIINLIGTVLSSRRSAQIALVHIEDPQVWEFATAKKDWWESDNGHRQQSNNSIIYNSKPSKELLQKHFRTMLEAGGSEPGIINGASCLRRAPYSDPGFNPCAEILLADKSFCNLVTINLMAIKTPAQFKAVMRLIARACYRQTCVDFRDGVLQDQWHHNNNFLRLMGISLTGQAGAAPNILEYAINEGHRLAHQYSDEMAEELGLPRSHNITTVKPEGTISKMFDCTEGVSIPLGQYIFNNISMSKYDPMLPALVEAGYETFLGGDEHSVIVKIPQEFEAAAHWFTEVNGTPVNLISAVEQLERYKLLMDNYVDHNCSITVSYDPEELENIIDWVYDNWDSYVGVSFILRADPTKTAKDLGYLYLPQEVVTKEVWEAYKNGLKKPKLSNDHYELLDSDCASGACPVR